jgi:hypothetical protein
MKRSFVPLTIVLSFALTGCSVVNRLLGVVPQADLDAANALLSSANARVTELEGQLAEKGTALAQLQTDLDAANARVGELEAEVASVGARNTTLETRNEDLESLICANLTWDEFFYDIAIWIPEDWFGVEGFNEAFTRLAVDWDFQPELTQWTTLLTGGTPWRDDLPGYLVIWDGQSAVWSVDEHCLILHPNLYWGLKHPSHK